MDRVDITRKGCFDKYKGKLIKIVDGDFAIVMEIDCYGESKDKKMEYWTDAEDENIITYHYDDHYFADIVTIFILDDNYERPCKRLKV